MDWNCDEITKHNQTNEAEEQIWRTDEIVPASKNEHTKRLSKRQREDERGLSKRVRGKASKRESEREGEREREIGKVSKREGKRASESERDRENDRKTAKEMASHLDNSCDYRITKRQETSGRYIFLITCTYE